MSNHPRWLVVMSNLLWRYFSFLCCFFQRWSISVNHRTSFSFILEKQIHEVLWGCLFSERTPKLKCSIYAWVPLIILCSTIRYRIKWGSSLHRLLFSAFLRNNPTAFSSNMKCTVCINIACRCYEAGFMILKIYMLLLRVDFQLLPPIYVHRKVQIINKWGK